MLRRRTKSSNQLIECGTYKVVYTMLRFGDENSASAKAKAPVASEPKREAKPSATSGSCSSLSLTSRHQESRSASSSSQTKPSLSYCGGAESIPYVQTEQLIPVDGVWKDLLADGPARFLQTRSRGHNSREAGLRPRRVLIY